MEATRRRAYSYYEEALKRRNDERAVEVPRDD